MHVGACSGLSVQEVNGGSSSFFNIKLASGWVWEDIFLARFGLAKSRNPTLLLSLLLYPLLLFSIASKLADFVNTSFS